MLRDRSWPLRGMTALLGWMAAGWPAVAQAEDPAKCNTAYEDADSLVRLGGTKLLEAREKLRVCARSSCKAWMIKECTKSLSEVEARIPSVVLVATDAEGHEVVDVTVTTEDKVELTRRLDGRAVEIGPGERVLTFTAADGRRVAVSVVVKEGEKAQRVTAKLEPSKPVAPAEPAPPPRAGGAPPPPEPASRRAAAPALSGSSGLRTTGFVLASAGVAGVVIGTVFGVKAIGNKSDAACDANNACDPEALSSARSAATVSTIGFVAGAALAAGGVALIILAPSRSSGTGRLELAPSLAQRDIGLTMRGAW